MLLCLCQDPAGQAVTYVSSIDNILRRLSKEEINYFRNEQYNFLSDYSPNGKSCRIDLNKWLPVIYGKPYDPLLRLDIDFMVARSPETHTALKKLNAIAWEVAEPIKLAAGDLLIIDNVKTAHARSAFQAQHDGRDRWIQRTFVVNSLRQHQASMNEQRVVTL